MRCFSSLGDRLKGALALFYSALDNVFRSSISVDASTGEECYRGSVYLYWFLWHTPVLDGRPLAYHCSELPFVFANTALDVATEGNQTAAALSEEMSSAWINFARHGNPNSALLPHWSPVIPGANPTMMFDTVCKMLVDPDKAEQLAIATV